jgi:hypothetical protein
MNAAKKAYDAARYAANRERLKAETKAYRVRNAEKIKAFKRRYYEENREAFLAASVEYRRKNPVVTRASWQRYHARKLKATIRDTALILRWMKTWHRKKRVVCYWCQQVFRGRDCHADHIVPLTKGGLHAIENLCVSCGSCNHKKHAKAISVWNQELTQPLLTL